MKPSCYYLICISALLTAAGCNKASDLPPASKPDEATLAAQDAQRAGSEWDALIQKATDLFRAGKYDRAVAVAQKALEVAEQKVGPNHPDVATSLNNLAAFYDTQGAYAKAEPLYQRSLAIWEKARGTDHPDVAASLNNLAGLNKTGGASAKAEPLF